MNLGCVTFLRCYGRGCTRTLAAGRVPVKAEVCYPVRVLAQLHTERLRHLGEQGRKEVDVLDEDVCVLHADDARALEKPGQRGAGVDC